MHINEYVSTYEYRHMPTYTHTHTESQKAYFLSLNIMSITAINTL